jgi:hypothetical protein
MAFLSISDAARVTGVSRVTLHRYIKAGRLSRRVDGTIDTAELLRVGLVLHPDTAVPVTPGVHLQPPATPTDTLTRFTPVTAPDLATFQQMIDLLQRELAAAHTREEAARERETLLLQMLQQVQQQNQRLLEAPRMPPEPPSLPRGTQSPPGAASPSQEPPGGQRGISRGAIRRAVVTLMHQYPDGLTPAQVRAELGLDKPLANTLHAMARDGLLRHLGHGRYGLP